MYNSGRIGFFMLTQYAHTLLFACPDCNRAIAVSVISDESSLEAEVRPVRVDCESCNRSFDLPALLAKMHVVTEWNDYNK